MRSGWPGSRYSRMNTYFFSYLLLVVAVLLALGVVIHASFFRTLQGVVEQSNVASLEQMRDQLDQRIEELQRMSVQMSRNTKLMPYMIAQGGFEAAQANQELRSYASTSSFLLDIGIYYVRAAPHKMVAASGVYDLDTFFAQMYPFADIGISDFPREAAALKGARMTGLSTLNVNGATITDAMLYLYPIPNNGTPPYEVIVYVINGAEMKKAVGAALKQFEGTALILDRAGEPLVAVASDPGRLDAARLLPSLPRQGAPIVSTFSLPEGDYASVRLESGVMPWSYHLTMPTEQFLKRVRHTQTIFYVTAAATLLLGVVLSYALATHHYRPIKRLLESVRTQHAGGAFAGADELAWISSAVEGMANENYGLRSRLRTKSAMFKEKLLSDLFKGNVKTAEDLGELAAAAGIRLGDETFAVLLFTIDDYRRFEETNTTIIQSLLKYSIMNVAEEIARETGYGYGLDLTDHRGVAVLVGMERTREPDETIQEIAEKTRLFFEQSFPFTVTVGVSDVFDQPLAAAKYVRQAFETVSYRFVQGPNCVIRYTELPDVGGLLPKPRHEAESRLASALRQGNREAAVRIIREEMNELRADGLPASYAQSICFRLVDEALKAVEDIGLAPGEEAEHDQAQLRSFPFETLDEFERTFARFCGRLADDIARKKESKNFELRDKLLAFIHGSFTDASLSLNAIAGQFGLSPSYLSRYFKNQTGIGISEYVDELRMEKARALLQASACTVKEVTEQVGYSDQTYFIRKFKKREGVTPQQYKQLYAAAGESVQRNE